MRTRAVSLPVVLPGILMLTGAVIAQDDDFKEPTAKETRALLEKMMADPLSEEGKKAAETITIVGIKTKQAMIILGEDLAWLPKSKPAHMDQLLAAYTAGSMQTQME